MPHANPPTPDPAAPIDPVAELDFARGVIHAEAQGLATLASRLGPGFTHAVELLVSCADHGGTIQVCGLGKSGLIGQKISATLASVGIPSHFIHPAEAVHGDLGRFRSVDVALCISHSGETDEVVNLAAILRQDHLPIIAILGGGTDPAAPATSLERLATTTIRLGVDDEAGGSAAPTVSTTAALAAGDALALAAARRRRFTNEDFARRHPGGSLGGQLRPVTEIMRCAGTNLPVVPADLAVEEALRHAATLGRRPGAILIIHPDRTLAGIFTDGDLRRLILRDPAQLRQPIASVMTPRPRSLSHRTLVRDAIRMIREHRQDEVPIVDDANHPVGLLDVQDLIAMRLVND